MSVTTRDSSGTIIVAPRNEAAQSGLVVISHGLGDTAEGFVDVAEVTVKYMYIYIYIYIAVVELMLIYSPLHFCFQFLAKELPHVKFILPTAPTQPVTMNMGMPMPSWYDITGLDERANENCKGLDQSKHTISQILENEHASTQLPYSRMVLAGFSQGGALSLFTGMQLPQKLAGIILLSGYLPAASQFQISPGLEDTPILHCHGSADPMVQLAVAQKSQELLAEKGAKEYVLKPYAGVVHTVSMEEIQDVKDFLKRVLPPDDSCKIAVKDPSDMSVKELKAAIRKAGLGQQAVGLMEKQEFVKLLKDHYEKE
jgi:lysophospholipase-2